MLSSVGVCEACVESGGEGACYSRRGEEDEGEPECGAKRVKRGR